MATGQGVASADTSTDGSPPTGLADGPPAAGAPGDAKAGLGASPSTHARPGLRARSKSLAKLRESQSAEGADAGSKPESVTKPDADITVNANSVVGKKKSVRLSKPDAAARPTKKLAPTAPPGPLAPPGLTAPPAADIRGVAIAVVVHKLAPPRVEFSRPAAVVVGQKAVAEFSAAAVAEGPTAAAAPKALLAPARISPVRTVLNLFALSDVSANARGPLAPLPRLPRLLEMIFVAVRKEVAYRLDNKLPTATYTPLPKGSDPETGVITGQVVASDPDNKPSDLTITPGTPPAHGSVVMDAAGNFTYTPDHEWAHDEGGGADSFTVIVSDANGPAHIHGFGSGADVHTTEYTVNLTVAPTNVKPTVTTVVGGAAADGTRTVTVTSVDADADTVSVTPTVSGPGALGTPTTTRSADFHTTTTVYTFTPNTAVVQQAGADQTATIGLEVNDSHGGVVDADPASVVVPFHNGAPDIGSVNVGDAATDGTRTITVTATDPDGDKPTFTIAGVDSGTVDSPAVTSSGNAVTATFVYRPNASYAASHPGALDGFTVTATDPFGLTDTDATAAIQIPVPPQNQKPVITNASASAPDANGKVTISATATDDGDAVTLTIDGGGGMYGLANQLFFVSGSTSGASEEVDYTPTNARRAEATASPVTIYDTITVTAQDDDGIVTQTVLVEVKKLATPVEPPPVVTPPLTPPGGGGLGGGGGGIPPVELPPHNPGGGEQR